MIKNPPLFHISDHMLLRYMERMLGVDVEDFRARLHAKLEPYAKAGVASVDANGMVFKFSYSQGCISVSTFWPSGHIPKKQRPPLARKDSREAMNIMARKRKAR